MWKSLLALVCAVALHAQPESWIDKDTGHRAVRLTQEPNSASLYFNHKKMVHTTPEGISALNLETHEAKAVVKGRVRIVVTGHKTQNEEDCRAAGAGGLGR